jgi:hypothetical protein
VRTTLDPDQILQRLGTLCKRGRLDGFVPRPGSTTSLGAPALFAAGASGTPFESILLAGATDDATGTMLRFERRLDRRWPVFFAVVLIATVWPGVHLMDMFMADWFPSLYPYTWRWYLPITILSLPFAWRAAIGKSRRTGDAEARLVIEGIAKELGATSEPETPAANRGS